MTEESGTNGARISNAEIFAEVRAIGARVDSVRQSVDEVVKPAIVRLENNGDAMEKAVAALNVKFYGVIGGIGLGILGAVAKIAGVY